MKSCRPPGVYGVDRFPDSGPATRPNAATFHSAGDPRHWPNTPSICVRSYTPPYSERCPRSRTSLTAPRINPDLPGQLGQHGLVAPVGLADELLEALPLPVVQVGDGLGGLGPEVRQEALDVAGGVAAPGVGPGGRGERP